MIHAFCTASGKKINTLGVAAMMDQTPSANEIDVLIAEDNEVNQMVFSFIMEELGLSFLMVGNGAEAVEKYQEIKPPIIIMDVSMPVMNGWEATKKIRELESQTGDHVIIIAATAHAIKGDRDRCFEVGMDDYVSKPISPDNLGDKILAWQSRMPRAAVGQ